MFGDGSLTFREYVMNEPLPLAIVHRAVLDFLHHRNDAALFVRRRSMPTSMRRA